MSRHTASLTSSNERKEKPCPFSAINGIWLGATIGMGTSIAAVAAAYITGYKYHHSYMKALHDGMFDMVFDTAAGGLFGGMMQHWQTKQWDEVFAKHNPQNTRPGMNL